MRFNQSTASLLFILINWDRSIVNSLVSSLIFFQFLNYWAISSFKSSPAMHLSFSSIYSSCLHLSSNILSLYFYTEFYLNSLITFFLQWWLDWRCRLVHALSLFIQSLTALIDGILSVNGVLSLRYWESRCRAASIQELRHRRRCSVNINQWISFHYIISNLFWLNYKLNYVLEKSLNS